MINVPPELRREYGLDALDESQMAGDPFKQFDTWFTQAMRAGVAEPNAMTLATADASGAPSARIVLLKAYDDRGFMFCTNYDSRKGQELASNPRAALCFHWQLLERQVRLEGKVEKTNRQESEEYFHTRPRGAQLGAWVSRQSQPIASRAALEQMQCDVEQRFENKDVPLPDSWGCYRLMPETVEFWQGRPSRLHDRIAYVRKEKGWELRRLSP
jgi:pyridoxamine 5'-phosphate oxidase